MVTRLLIRGGQVYEHDGDVHHPRRADLLIEDGAIRKVAENIPAEGAEALDASGCLLIPGLINAHYHSHDTLCRGLFEELPLEMWLLYTLPMGRNRSKEEVRARTLVGALECLRSGITCVQDMLGLVPLDDAYTDIVLSAYREAGIRVVFSPMLSDVPPVAMVRYRDELPPGVQDMLGTSALPAREQLDYLEHQLRRHPAGGTLHWAVAPFAPQRCTSLLLESCALLAKKHDLPVYTHVYETRGQVLTAREEFAHHGGSFVTYLRDTGLLGPRLNIVHSVWISRAEMAAMAEAEAGIVLNHVSNMKLKSGIAPVADLLASGVRLGLGCDNCSGSDVQNLFQAMKLFCLFAAVSEPEPGMGIAHDAIRFATLGNARTAGLQDRLGALKPGMRADIVLIDLKDPSWLPFNSAARQLVYSESGRGVRSVIVDGRIVVRDGRCTSLDEAALHHEVADLMRPFLADFDAVVKSREAALPHMKRTHRKVWQSEVGTNRFLPRAR
jgi:cytosine/adenosine deaminase-related metal-dependent hydrolase